MTTNTMRVFLNERGAGCYVEYGSICEVDGTKTAAMATARRAAEALRAALPADPLERATAICDGLYAEAAIHMAAYEAAWGVDKTAFERADRVYDGLVDRARTLWEAGDLIFGRGWYQHPETRRRLARLARREETA